MAVQKAVRAGRAFIEMFLETGAIDRQLQAVGRRIQSAGRGIATAGAGISAAGAAIGTPLIAAATSVAEMGTELNKVSVQTGATVEELGRLQAAAGALRIDPDDLIGAIEELNIRLGEAEKDGVGPLFDAFQAIEGVELGDIISSGVEERVGKLGDAIRGLPREQRGFLADEIFGGDAFKILPLLRQGSEGIEALGDSAERLGRVLSGRQVADAQAFTQAWAGFKNTIAGVTTQIGAALLPSLTAVFDIIQPIALGIADFVRENAQFVVIVGAVSAGLIAAGTALVGLGAAISLAGTALGGFVAIITFIASPIGIVVAALVGLGAAFFTLTEDGQRATDSLKEGFGGLLDEVLPTLDAIRNAIAGGDFAAAAEVLWSALNLVWLRATEGITQTTLEWWAIIQDTFNRLRSNVIQIWRNLTNFFTGAWQTAVNAVARAALYLREALDFSDTFDLQGALEQLDAANEAVKRQRQQRFDSQSEELQRETERRSDEIFAASNEAVRTAEQQLDDARTRFQRARERAAAVEGPERGPGGDAAVPESPRTQINQLAQETASAIRALTTATFRGDIADRLFGTGADPQLSEAKKQTGILENIEKNTSGPLGITFG